MFVKKKDQVGGKQTKTNPDLLKIQPRTRVNRQLPDACYV